VINNSWACQNSYMLNKILKTELAFPGYVGVPFEFLGFSAVPYQFYFQQVQSDWGAQHSGVASANAGLDMTMPGQSFPSLQYGTSMAQHAVAAPQAIKLWGPTIPSGGPTLRELVNKA
jgi:beta-glucosidase